jgi:hypothetical protein
MPMANPAPRKQEDCAEHRAKGVLPEVLFTARESIAWLAV